LERTSRDGLTRRTLVGMAAAGLLEARVGVALADHPVLREADGRPVKFYDGREFQNWGRTVRHTPALTFVPRSRHGVREIVRWSIRNNKRVRACGYRHTWPDLYSAEDQVLISMLRPADVETLPVTHPPLDPDSDLQGIELVGTVEEDGTTKALCRFGAATSNEQFRQWCLDEQRGDWEWTLPLNVIMVEITLGGSNAPICHGAGLRNRTLSDLVHEIEFVNPRGRFQRVSDPRQLKAAAGCFGLLGIVTAVTLKLDPMTFATLQPTKPRLGLAIPPPDGFPVPAGVDMTGIADADLAAARERFFAQCEHEYYAEWFWFPFQSEAWVNCWRNDGARADAQPYPAEHEVAAQEAASYFIETSQTSVFADMTDREQAEFFGSSAQAAVPSDVTIVTPLIEALHFRRGIHNFRVLDMEFEIPIPPRADDPSKPDWSICQQAWWDVIRNVYERPDAPMRVALEMRVMGASSMWMAPQRGNRFGTCSIEVLTNARTPAADWRRFKQDIADLWLSYTDHRGRPLNTRPHWAKEWEGVRYRGQTAVGYLRDEAYAEQIPRFRAGLRAVAHDGGYSVSDLRRFSNPLLDRLLRDVFA